MPETLIREALNVTPAVQMVELELTITAAYERDRAALVGLSEPLEQEIEELAELFAVRPEAFYERAEQPVHVVLFDDVESSLFVVELSGGLSVIVSADEPDPIFGTASFCLFRLVENTQARGAYIETARKHFDAEGVIFRIES